MDEKIFPVMDRYNTMIFENQRILKNLKIRVEKIEKNIKRLAQERDIIKGLKVK